MSDQIAVEDLTDALNRLQTQGWTRGIFASIATGECCALGAFGWPWPTDSPGIPFLAHAARSTRDWKAPKDINDLAVIIRYNDAPGRTFQQIERLFIRAISAASEAVTGEN